MYLTVLKFNMKTFKLIEQLIKKLTEEKYSQLFNCLCIFLTFLNYFVSKNFLLFGNMNIFHLNEKDTVLFQTRMIKPNSSEVQKNIYKRMFRVHNHMYSRKNL